MHLSQNCSHSIKPILFNAEKLIISAGVVTLGVANSDSLITYVIFSSGLWMGKMSELLVISVAYFRGQVRILWSSVSVDHRLETLFALSLPLPFSLTLREMTCFL